MIFTETTTLGVRRRQETRQGAGAALGKRSNAMGRGADENRQHEWHGDELRAGI